MSARRLSWLALAVVVAGGLAFGALDDDGPTTSTERAHALASTLRCPTCRSQSAADSDAAAAKAIRAEIERRIADGQSDDQIRDYLVSRYGQSILLTPARSGLAGLVWVVPVVLLVVGVAAVVLVLRRWQARSPRAPTDDDRRLVDQALRER